jgi:hypothetical protein
MLPVHVKASKIPAAVFCWSTSFSMLRFRLDTAILARRFRAAR